MSGKETENSVEGFKRILISLGAKPDGKDPNCFLCEHFRVTWNPQFPRACSLFGFKGKEIPARMVKRASGLACPGFKEKRTSGSEGQKNKGWTA